MSSDALAEIDAIRRLKYAYLRLLDSKRFDDIGDLLTEDATSAYQSGELSQNGRADIVTFLKESLSGAGIVTMHTCHHPEIDLEDDARASGTWYLEDLVIVPGADLEIHGTALYADKYVKLDGAWRISHTGYQRIFERHSKLSTGEMTSFRSRFDT